MLDFEGNQRIAPFIVVFDFMMSVLPDNVSKIYVYIYSVSMCASVQVLCVPHKLYRCLTLVYAASMCASQILCVPHKFICASYVYFQLSVCLIFDFSIPDHRFNVPERDETWSNAPSNRTATAQQPHSNRLETQKHKISCRYIGQWCLVSA